MAKNGVKYAYDNIRPPPDQTNTSDDSDVDDDEPAYDNATPQPVEQLQEESSFCRSMALGHFNCPVDIEETDASKRCGLGNAEYQLTVDSFGISLEDPKIVIFTWPFKYIRRYGRGSEQFVLEVGRRAPSGEGVFRFRTTTPDKLHAAVAAGMNGDSIQPSASSSLDDMYAKVNKPTRSTSYRSGSGVGQRQGSGEGLARSKTMTHDKRHGAVTADITVDSGQSLVEDLYAKVNKPTRSPSSESGSGVRHRQGSNESLVRPDTMTHDKQPSVEDLYAEVNS